ncbi:MAG: MFS transporter [Caulobacteraceae bacterium]
MGAPAATLAPLARLKAILGGSAGNLVEWYDWFAYASFSLYFAKVFFPGGDQTAQLLQTAAVFAVGFFARPLGAWIMGLYADRRGRKAALVASVALMCLGSLIVAVVPGYATIGAAAPAILTLARLIQGLSVGGEYGASATYMSEMAGARRRGFWSSFQFVTLIAGQLLALGVLIVLQHILSRGALDAWGWRIPFVIGAALAVVVFWIQRGLDESAVFAADTRRGSAGSGAVGLVAAHPRETFIVFVLSAAGGLGFYAYTTYMQKFLANTAHFGRDTATAISAASLIFYVLVIPAFGWLGDRIGRTRLIAIAFGLGALAAFPLMTAIGRSRDAGGALLLVCGAIALLAGYSAVNAVVKAELFPTHLRALGVSLPYALGNAAFGGTAEYIALAFKQAGRESGFFVYLAVVQALACLAALSLRDTRKHGWLTDD